MSFVKLTGEQGTPVYVKPLWVHTVEGFAAETSVWLEGDYVVIHLVDGSERIVLGTAEQVVATLYPPTEPKRTTVRRVAAE